MSASPVDAHAFDNIRRGNQYMQKLFKYSLESEKLTSYLKLRGLRKTPERFEILRCALEHNGHFDVDSLYQDLEEKGYHVSRATIYSALELLCGAGIVRRLLFDTHQARYEMAGDTHSHLVCTECGDIKEIELGESPENNSIFKKEGFSPAYVSTCVYGICSKCLTRLRK